MKSLTSVLDALITDVKRHHPDVEGLDRDLLTIGTRVKDEGVGFLTITLPSLGKHLDKCLSKGVFAPHPSFSRMKGSTLPKFLSGLFCKVFDQQGHLLNEGSEHLYVKSLREILYLFRKLTLSVTEINTLDRKAKSSFFKLEVGLNTEFQSDFLVESVSRLVLKNLDVFDFLEGRNGPGAVSEGYRSNQKWYALADGIVSHDDAIVDLGYDVEGFLQSDQPTNGTLRASDVRLVTVAKNSNSRRTITIEPAMRQFAQQALNTHLREQIDFCSVLRCCLSLTDQSKNQYLAMVGSKDGSYSTIDLSSASDLLSLSLVEKIFAHRPRYRELCLRSRCSSVKGHQAQLLKYAGMGNATTFPIQSVVFAVLAIASVLESEGLYPSFGNVVSSARKIRVYGDDIIVPTKSFHQTVTRLSTFGLKVNESKTFYEGNFRESCGTDWFRGYDVTPVYIRYEPKDTSMTASAVVALVANSNSMWKSCNYTAATHLSERVEMSLRKRLPLAREHSDVLGWHTRKDWAQLRRWNPQLHYYEVDSYQQYNPKVRDPVDGYAALLKFYHTPLVGRAVDHLEFSQRRFNLKLRKRWVRAL